MAAALACCLVLDADLEPLDGTQPWFVMGLARPIQKELSAGPPLKRVVEARGHLWCSLTTE